MKLVMWCICWLLYIVGDTVSRVIDISDRLAWLYPAYNWLMIRSADINDAYGFKLWHKGKE